MTRRAPGLTGQFALFDDANTLAAIDTAERPGLVVVDPAGAVYQRTDDTDRTGRVEQVDTRTADTVHNLITTGRLALGDPVRITDPETAETRTATQLRSTSAEPAPAGPVRLFVDVVRPGLGLVTAADGSFSGSIVREDGAYLLETEHGEVIGRASSYRTGAVRLARHHDRRPGAVEIEHEHEARR